MNLRSVLLSIFCLALTSCSGAAKNYPSLVDRGILGLSDSNPYLGSNLFLGEELQRSRYLFNFFRNRGAPAAIELHQGAFGPTQMLLYYPAQSQVYKAEITDGKSGNDLIHEWIVRGPYAVSRQDYRTVNQIGTGLSGEPVFLLYGKQFRFREVHPAQSAQVLKPVIPEYTAKAQSKKKSIKKQTADKAPGQNQADQSAKNTVAAPVAAPQYPLSSDQQALLEFKGYAPRTQNGDLTHTVRSDAESLEDIAKWYTGNPANREAIAKENALAPDSKLSIGTKLKIPASLVKETKLMPIKS